MRLMARSLLFAGTTALLFLLAEGLSSILLLSGKLLMSQPPRLADARHTRYDRQLGWANTPDLFVGDMYGPGVYVRINGQGFRANGHVTPDTPLGRLRIVCSGDSFTFGYGVSNDQTWCALLSAIDPRIETVNMGQSGYGVDQAYLWYVRDGTRLDHDVHLFPVVTPDFDRMEQDNFLGYPKPILTLDGDRLMVRNVPVPERSSLRRWIGERAGAVNELRSVQLLRRLRASASGPIRSHGSEAERLRLALRVFEETSRLNAAKKRVFVLVYLPLSEDYLDKISDVWRRSIGRESAARGIVMIDLVEALRRRPAAEISDLFIRNGSLEYLYAEGHYTVNGNEFIARELYDQLRSIDVTRQKLETIRATR
jgi:hypothetical protein